VPPILHPKAATDFPYSLRANPDELTTLKEQLFKLWGNLEELKTLELESRVQSRKRLAAHQPPLDSSDNEDESGDRHNSAIKEPEKLSNKPFTCCLRQYGVEMPEADPAKWDAGEGKRYERMFGLFGTKICS
jgi:protection-of-telomeres protein 1